MKRRPLPSLFWPIQLALWSAFGLSTYLTLLPAIAADARGVMFASKMIRAFIGLAASLLLRALYRWLRRSNAGIGVTMATALAACVLLGTSWLLLYRLAVVPALDTPSPPWDVETYPRAALDLVFVLIAWSALYLGAHAWWQAEEQHQRIARAEHEARSAQLRMLAYQLNPHFLFNTLNSIRAMISEDSTRARGMVTELADFLRHTLERDPTRDYALEDEIAALSHYLAIEAVRFEDRLDISAQIQPAARSVQVPALLVQPLVENAIKHGRPDDRGILRLRLDARVEGDDLVITVSNTGSLNGGEKRNGTVQRGQASRVGWSNVASRLETRYPGRSRFDVQSDDGWVTVRLTLPLPSLPAHA